MPTAYSADSRKMRCNVVESPRKEGDPSQNSKRARDELLRQNIRLFSTPPRSPDLNPIENLFNQVCDGWRHDKTRPLARLYSTSEIYKTEILPHSLMCDLRVKLCWMVRHKLEILQQSSTDVSIPNEKHLRSESVYLVLRRCTAPYENRTILSAFWQQQHECKKYVERWQKNTVESCCETGGG